MATAAAAEMASSRKSERSAAADEAARSRRVRKLKITQVRSQIGQSEKHRGTLRALGLGKIGRTVEHEESPRSPVCSGRSATSSGSRRR